MQSNLLHSTIILDCGCCCCCRAPKMFTVLSIEICSLFRCVARWFYSRLNIIFLADIAPLYFWESLRSKMIRLLFTIHKIHVYKSANFNREPVIFKFIVIFIVVDVIIFLIFFFCFLFFLIPIRYGCNAEYGKTFSWTDVCHPIGNIQICGWWNNSSAMWSFERR